MMRRAGTLRRLVEIPHNVDDEVGRAAVGHVAEDLELAEEVERDDRVVGAGLPRNEVDDSSAHPKSSSGLSAHPLEPDAIPKVGLNPCGSGNSVSVPSVAIRPIV